MVALDVSHLHCANKLKKKHTHTHSHTYTHWGAKNRGKYNEKQNSLDENHRKLTRNCAHNNRINNNDFFIIYLSLAHLHNVCVLVCVCVIYDFYMTCESGQLGFSSCVDLPPSSFFVSSASRDF